MKGLSLRVCVGLLVVVGLAWAQAASNEVCAGCHDVAEKMKGTAHANEACNTCHIKHEEYPHPEKVVKPKCDSCHEDAAADLARSIHEQERKNGNQGTPDCAVCHGEAHKVSKTTAQQFRSGMVETCGMCHDKVSADFVKSVHGKAISSGSAKAPACFDCHRGHAIQKSETPSSSVNARNIRETCGQCHAGVALSGKFNLPRGKVESFDASFHGLALKTGLTTAANCASCHGVHNILASTDTNSTIHPKNLPATCGRCHPGAGQRYAIGPMHTVEGQQEPLPITYARYFYLAVIPGTLGFMLLHNGGDWLRKLFKYRVGAEFESGHTVKPIVPELRMPRKERRLHFLLLTSFITLTWSGFALVYPDQWWARPLLLWESQWPVRGTIHRVAAVVFVYTTLAHGWLLLKDERFRAQWASLLPKWRDLREAYENFLYVIGLRKEQPKLSGHNYIEKVEYWAVVWGAVVMILTGLPLWFNTFFLRFIPKWLMDFFTYVHFWEAVLASAAIVIWHFYYVFLDPEVYPMDPAWLTGFSARRRHGHHEEEKAGS